jgi:hypothetical protein
MIASSVEFPVNVAVGFAVVALSALYLVRQTPRVSIAIGSQSSALNATESFRLEVGAPGTGTPDTDESNKRWILNFDNREVCRLKQGFFYNRFK